MFCDRHHVLDTHNCNPLFLSVTVIGSDQKLLVFNIKTDSLVSFSTFRDSRVCVSLREFFRSANGEEKQKEKTLMTASMLSRIRLD